MPEPTATTPDARAPVARLAAWTFAAVALVGGAGALGAWLTAPQATGSAVAATVAALLGTALGLVPLVLAGDRPPFALAMAQVFGSSVRLVVAAGAAVAALSMGGLDPVWTLGVVLVAMLAALSVELAVIVPALSGRPMAEAAR